MTNREIMKKALDEGTVFMGFNYLTASLQKLKNRVKEPQELKTVALVTDGRLFVCCFLDGENGKSYCTVWENVDFRKTDYLGYEVF